MADRERNDLRREIEATRRLLEARELRRTQMHQQRQPAGVRAARAAFGPAARWAGNRPGRLLVTAAVVILGAASAVASFPITDDGSGPPRIAALPDDVTDGSTTVADGPAADVTATLSIAGQGGADQPDVESGDPSAGSHGARAGSGDAPTDDDGAGAEAAAAGVPTNSPTPDPAPHGTTETTGGPVPELSDTEPPDDGPSAEPEPTESAEPEAPDDDGAAPAGTCLGVDALGLTVDLCLPSLLSG